MQEELLQREAHAAGARAGRPAGCCRIESPPRSKKLSWRRRGRGRAPRPRCRRAPPRAASRGGAGGRHRRAPAPAAGAGSARRSTLPLAVERQRGEEHERRRHHVLGQPLPRGARAARATAGAGAVAADDVGDQPLVARRRPRARAPTASRTAGCAPSAASISPSSMRKPRIFTWWSMRPRYSRSPSAQPARQVAGAVEPRARRAAERVGRRSARRSARAGRGSRGRRRRRRRRARPARPTGTGSPRASRT